MSLIENSYSFYLSDDDRLKYRLKEQMGEINNLREIIMEKGLLNDGK